MKVISWNILHGQPVPPPAKPMSPKLAHDLLDQAVTRLGDIGADLIGLQEVDDGQSRSSDLSQISAMAKSLGAVDWAYAPTVIGTPGEKWRALNKGDVDLRIGAHTSDHASYGIGLISKIPVTKWHKLDLGRSLIGLPLAIPGGGASGDAGGDAGGDGDTESISDKKKSSIRFIYVRDEPRVALAAELENGYTVVVTHLSFVPFVNYFQLMKIRRWVANLPGIHIIMGDLNLGWGLPVRGTHWRSLVVKNSYPSWNPKIQFDYITAHIPHFGERNLHPLDLPDLGVSDHLPIGVEIN
jgi:endonuclease/exonuclease/phosphatase family metal-dependent hydrolase